MYEYTIPQEFNQSDKIGNLSMPQVFILGFGVLVMMFLAASGLNLFIAILLDIPIGIGTLYLMYKKINKIPLYEFILVFAVYKTSPKLLLYRANNLKDEFDEEALVVLFEDEGE